MDRAAIKESIARRVTREFKYGDVINLGIGLPTLAANYIPPGMDVIFQSENGMLGLGPAPSPGRADPEITNAGGQPVTVQTGGCFFDSCGSFEIIRGGHVDVTVLGALQVDARGNLANWIIPGRLVPGMGGAMDLVSGAKRVIVAMEHTAKGAHKILRECTLPLTAAGAVDLIITEMCVMEVTESGLLLTELRNGFSLEDVRRATGADFNAAAGLF